MDTAPALVKLMECGLGARPLVNVSEHVTINVKLSIRVAMGPAFLISIVSLCFYSDMDTHYGLLIRN